MYQGPITYQGNKRRLMPQIAPLLKPTNVFIDLFCGSGTVGLNAPAEKVLFNDLNKPVISLLKFLANTPFDDLYGEMIEVTKKYDLPWRAEGRMPEGTIQAHIKPGFLKMRDDYNAQPSDILLFSLMIYGFSKQIRFTKTGKFSNPSGDNDFNLNAQKKIVDYQKRLREIDAKFLAWDFMEFLHFHLQDPVMYYADPPYLKTTAIYSNVWNLAREQELYDFLDKKNADGDFFAFSNAIEIKGEKHEPLIAWLAERDYTVHELDINYNSSSYQRNNEHPTREVLITNY